MNTEKKFFHSNTAIVTLFAACFVVLISLGVRQTFGLFFIDFNESLNISNTAFGFAIGTQMLMWGLTGPIFGAIADRFGGHVAIISCFLFYTFCDNLQIGASQAVRNLFNFTEFFSFFAFWVLFFCIFVIFSLFHYFGVFSGGCCLI